jgi:methyltransferase family protein
VLPASLQRIQRTVPDSALVLDVGGWAEPLQRADWVIDLQPYETRGLYGSPPDPGRERFSPETWLQRDICDREPWPFHDGQFDFASCSQTLEDVRDPVWVCSELRRVARAGYIEVPSRLEEQALGVDGPWAGWSHHRWLVDVVPGRVEFTFKPHLIHVRESDHFPPGFHATLTAEQRVQCLWWEGSFEFAERIHLEAATLDPYLADFVAEHVPPRSRGGPVRSALRRALRRSGAQP